MTVGELKGILFWANPQPPVAPPANPVSFANLAAIFLKIWNPHTGIVTTQAMTAVVPDTNIPVGHYAVYVAQVGDFPVAGTYLLEIVATWTDGTVRKTPEKLFSVGPSL